MEYCWMPVINGKINFLKAMKTLELVNFSLVNVKNIIADGDYVVVQSSSKIIEISGESDNPAYCDIYRFKNGKIKELTTYVVDTTLTE